MLVVTIFVVQMCKQIKMIYLIQANYNKPLVYGVTSWFLQLDVDASLLRVSDKHISRVRIVLYLITHRLMMHFVIGNYKMLII